MLQIALRGESATSRLMYGGKGDGGGGAGGGGVTADKAE